MEWLLKRIRLLTWYFNCPNSPKANNLRPDLISAANLADHRVSLEPSLREAVVFLEDGAELVVGKRDDVVIFDASHGFRGNHGVDDGFFGGLDSCGEEDR